LLGMRRLWKAHPFWFVSTRDGFSVPTDLIYPCLQEGSSGGEKQILSDSMVGPYPILAQFLRGVLM
jgi:hypothetical protein